MHSWQQCPAGRCHFKYRIKLSNYTMAGSRNESDSKIQTVGTATEKAGVPNILRRNREIFSLRQLAKRKCLRPETSVTATQHLVDLYTEDTDEQSREACTAPAVEVLASADHQATTTKDHTLVSRDPVIRLRCSVLNRLQHVCDILWRRRQDRVAIIDSWCDKRMNQYLYWFIVQRATDSSLLTKPEEACLTDIYKVHVQTKFCGNPHTIVVINHRLWVICSTTYKYINLIIDIQHKTKKLIVLLRHIGL